MKHVSRLICMMSLFIAIACSKNDNQAPGPGTPVRDGLVTPVGTPVEAVVNEENIGSAGGTLYSTDGRMKIIVPPGAVKQAYKFSIQRITNTNPLGKGVAYRMQPHGINFDKPVTLSIRHDELDRRGTTPDALNIAVQDERGVWQAIGGKAVDAANGTISVSTLHFSDYSLFESFSIKPGFNVIEPGANVQLEVVSTENLLAVPLTKDVTVPIGNPIPVIAHYIKTGTWKLNGEGTLDRAGHRAVYTAPAHEPADNPVSVSVELDLGQDREQLTLVTAIQVADEGELEISIGGGAPVLKKGYRVVEVKPGYYGIAHSQGYEEDGTVLLIRWLGRYGSHPWNAVASGSPDANTFNYSPRNSNTDFYISFYVVDDEVFDSGGGVNISDMGELDGFVRGTFNVSPTGYGMQLAPSVAIAGKFKLKKSW